ncbi:DUF5336 domain-containing protein [Amycolatopsis endophytica]|uniref:34 kDa antigenic protein n=1 Tax=Amycolatopsis endophytica TaxID=860233 RepID=A0A853AYH9_9PSEU|nr:DUF5336 domain-containing protein [Amycolatopsis endophytica]NYI87689.1 hypothetical protein [Amycolatopsis endophytica]
MTFPSGGPGYPQQGGGGQPQPPGTGGFPQQQPPAQQPGAGLSPANLSMILTLFIALLGLVNYFIAFSDEAQGASQSVLFLLVGGLLAGLSVMPKGPRTLPFAALFSVLGALSAILVMVHIPELQDTPGILTVILILGILQMLVAIAALLLDAGVLKMPQPRAPQYGQPYGQPGQFGQGPGEQKGGPSGTQYGPPVNPPQAQSTVYAPQQGQFYNPAAKPESQPGQQGQPGQQPGTPPGGFGGGGQQS